MIVVALSSGTSVDAVDVAAADLRLDGDMLGMRLLGHRESPWPTGVRHRLLGLLPPARVTVGEVCRLDTEVGQAFADVARAAVRDLAAGRADLVVSHGQTVFHGVGDGGQVWGTMQLGQPAWVAEATGLPVVADLRVADVAAGGQGAPLASTLDALWLNGSGGVVAALNLGGIANVTLVAGGGAAAASVTGWDTGPASCLLDLAATRLAPDGPGYDADGRLASAGTVHQGLLEHLLTDAYFRRPAPKSTGREHFGAGLLDAALAAVPAPEPADVMATLVELTAVSVTQSLRREATDPVRQVVASGGGTRNPALMAALRRRLAGTPLVTSDELGLPAEAKEAYLFALLGFLSWHGLPGVAIGPGGRPATGARGRRVLGRFTPGRGPLRLPEPVAVGPVRLVLES